MMKKAPRNSYTAGELARIVKGELIGDPSRTIIGVSGVDESRPDKITFAENNDYLTAAEHSAAGLVIVPRDIEGSSKDLLKVDDARLAYARVAQLFTINPFYKPGIHATAVVAESVQLGKEVSIHPHVVIDDNAVIGNHVCLAAGVYVGSGVRIGDYSVIHPQVVIEAGSVIGSHVIIHGGTVIGSDGYGFVTSSEGHIKIPQLGNVIIEDNVEVGANVTIDRGASGPTIISQGTKIDNLVQIAHNVKVGRENLIVAQVGIAGSARTGRRVTVAGQSGIVGHIEVGDNTTIAANSLVTKNTPAGVFYSGNPAQSHKQELKEQAARRKFPEMLKRIKKLEKKIDELVKRSE